MIDFNDSMCLRYRSQLNHMVNFLGQMLHKPESNAMLNPPSYMLATNCFTSVLQLAQTYSSTNKKCIISDESKSHYGRHFVRLTSLLENLLTCYEEVKIKPLQADNLEGDELAVCFSMR